MVCGVAVEVSYPATLSRFENFQPDAQLAFFALALSSWLYHFCQVGTAVLASATSLVALRTGVLPGWLALAGFVVALLALLHFLVPLLAALVGLLWLAVVSVLMLIGAVGSSTSIRRLDTGRLTSLAGLLATRSWPTGESACHGHRAECTEVSCRCASLSGRHILPNLDEWRP